MIGRRRELTGVRRCAIAVFSIAMSLLLVNAIAIAPAGHVHTHEHIDAHEGDHEHDPAHDSSTCLICVLVATGVWTYSASPQVPAPSLAAARVPASAPARTQPAALRLPPVRGPPLPA